MDDTTASETFELYGPVTYSMEEIGALVDKEIIHKRRHINLPKRLFQPLAYYFNKFLWWHVPGISADEVEQQMLNQVIDRNAKTLADLGIEGADLKDLTYHYLQDYRGSSFYDLPPATEREKREERKYLHVIDDQ
jgi:NADH dehydrogenase (ubiquinone) 1 alpha subcomplex subunit 9